MLVKGDVSREGDGDMAVRREEGDQRQQDADAQADRAALQALLLQRANGPFLSADQLRAKLAKPQTFPSAWEAPLEQKRLKQIFFVLVVSQLVQYSISALLTLKAWAVTVG